MPHTRNWAMEPCALKEYREFIKNFAGKNLTEEISTYFDQIRKQVAETGAVVIKDAVAEISIRGVLGNWIDFWDFLYFGYLDSYPSIIAALELAEADEKVESIRFIIDSPGGRADGIYNLLYKIQGLEKPVESLIESQAASGAYLIASQTDRIIAQTEMVEVGSIGIGISIYISDNFVDITSTEAPKKWPDASTEEGKKIILEDLDNWHEKMVSTIAEGRTATLDRTVTSKEVNENFGRGGMLLAESALKAGMLDIILPKPEKVSNSQFFSSIEVKKPHSLTLLNPEFSEKSKKMSEITLKTVQTEYSEVYEQITEKAVKAERNRVKALITAGKASGKIDYALECIEKGLSIQDDVVQATFLTAKINKNALNDREKENPENIETPSEVVNEEEKAKEDARKAIERRNAGRK